MNTQAASSDSGEQGRSQDQDQDQGQDQGREHEEQPAAQGAPPFWEWVVAGIGAALVLASLGYLSWQAVHAEHGPPQPVLEVVAIDAQPRGWLVRIRARNGAQASAARLKVAGTLRQEGRELETAETEFQYLPGGSAREGGLFFTRDPRGLQLELAARSYEKP